MCHRHLVQSIASVKASDVAAVAARWRPRLVHGAQYGDEASQPPIADRERVVSVAVELSALALRSGRDLYLWDTDFNLDPRGDARHPSGRRQGRLHVRGKGQAHQLCSH